MMGQLEPREDGDDIRGVQVAGPEVEKTMWVFARMGTKLGDRMMGELEWRTESISEEFNSEEVANTVSVFATMGTKPCYS